MGQGRLRWANIISANTYQGVGIDGVRLADLGSNVVIPVGGGNDPVPGGTIVFDTRAGGAQSYQADTNLAEIEAEWNDIRYTGASGFFSDNVDGAGTNAFGCQWNNATGSEQECMLGRNVSAPNTGWYTQYKMYLGRSPTGGGTGTLGQWTLTGGNPHQKTMMWNRASDPGESHRIYVAQRPGECKFEIDGTSWVSNNWSENPYNYTGTVQKITVYIQPTTGIVKVWRNGNVVMDMTGQQAGVGTMGLAIIYQSVTTFPGQQQVQYFWDTVVWY